MTLRSYTLTFDGNIQQLSSLLAAGVLDIPVYVIDIQADVANAAVFYVGASDVDADNGLRIPVPVDSVPEAPYRIGSFDEPNVALSGVYVLGTNGQKAHILIFA